MEGWTIQIDRQIFSSDINYKPPERFKIWIYLLSNVQRQDFRNLKRWQWFFKYQSIAELLWVKYNTVSKFMVWAESGKMLARQKTMRWVVITVLNYDKYQDFGKITARQKQDKSKIKAKLYNEEYKENKENKETGETIKAIIGYLNEESGKKFKTSTVSSVKYIKARINEGYSFADFKRVIKFKVKEWRGTSQEVYIRPETLFGNKMDWYLNSSPAEKNKTIDDFIAEAETNWRDFISKNYWFDKRKEVYQAWMDKQALSSLTW